jgi:hypothetical protein
MANKRRCSAPTSGPPLSTAPTLSARPPQHQQSWFLQFGIPVAAVGIGVSIMGWTNFWFGLGVATIAYAFLVFDLLRFLEHRKTWERIIVGISALMLYLFFAWTIFVPTPLDVLLFSTPGNYDENTDIYGIKWKSNFTELGIVIENDTGTNYTDLDAYIRTDVTIATGAISSGGVNQCSLEADLPGLQIAGAQLNIVGTQKSIPLFLNRLNPATIYRLRCPRVASKSRVDARFAVVGAPGNNKVQPRWAKLSAEYDACLSG